MLTVIIEKLRKIFCRHEFVKYAWYEEYDNRRNERYAVRLYRCEKCGKEIQVDGRYDPYWK